MIRRVLLPSLAVLAAACAEPSAEPSTPATAAPSPAHHRTPRLVVAIILDQLGSEALDRYWDVLPEDGALRNAAARGAFHHRVAFSYAGTYTAPGHATVHTGVPPRTHGVFSNLLYDRTRHAVVPIVDDGAHPWWTRDDAHASPKVLGAPTVADRLEEHTGGRAITAAVSVKDRGAILPGGQRPDLALWYDKKRGRYTSSTYYGEGPPAWLVQWAEAHPVQSILVPWEAGDPRLLARAAGTDDAPGEGDWHGLGTTFPHDPSASDRPLSVVRATPASSEHLLVLAHEMVRRLGMGDDEVPDLLSVSISSTDYVGHVFGPHSWEYLDNLLRVDRALGHLLAILEQRTDLAVLITSDHGAAPLPEEREGPSGRLDPEALGRSVEAALDAEVGAGDWVAAVSQPFLYLTDWAREDDDRRAAAMEVALRVANADRAVGAAFDARALARLDLNGEVPPIERAAALTTPPDTGGDLFLVPARDFVVDEGMAPGKGTSHGTPWPYDREVPVLFWGPGVTPVETSDPLPMARTAPTLAALLGLPAPPGPDPLPGAGDSTSAPGGARHGASPGR